MANEPVNFVLTLKDSMSGPLAGIGRTGQRAFNQVEKGADHATESVKDNKREVQNLDGAMGGLMRSARNLIGAYVGLETVKAIGNIGMQAEQTALSMEVMLGSADKAKMMIAGIDQFANATPYDNTGLMENAKLLLNFGIAGEKVIPTLKMIGDVSAGDANKMNSLTLAFAQMQSAGRLMGQDLLQMINAGFNPLQIISEKTGVSMGDLKKQMEDGAISSDMVTAAFQSATTEGGRFNGMMDRLSTTTSGKLSTAMGTLKIKGVELFNIVQPGINMMLDLGISFLNNSTAMETFAYTVGIGAAAWAAYKVQAWAASLANRGVSLSLKGIGMAIRSIPIVGWIAMGVEAFMLLYQHSETFRGGLWGIWEVAKELGAVLVPLGKLMGAVMSGNVGAIPGLLSEARNAYNNMDVKGAWERGMASGKGSSQLKGLTPESDNGTSSLGTSGGADPFASVTKGVADDKMKGTKGTGGSRSVVVNISKLIESQIIQAGATVGETTARIREEVERALVEAVRDFEVSYD